MTTKPSIDRRTGLLISASFVMWICGSIGASGIETDFQVKPEMLEPAGQYYEATVPDTLDLAERAKLSVRGLTSFLNEKKHYEPYGHGLFNTDPPFLTTRFAPGDGGGAPNWGKISDAIILTRSMCGSHENLDIEAKTIEGMIHYIRGRNSVPSARVTMSLMSLYQQSSDPKLYGLIKKLADSLRGAIKIDGEYAYFWDLQRQPEVLRDQKTGLLGWSEQVYTHGSVLRALSRWTQWSGDADYFRLTDEVKNHLLRKEFWYAEAAPKLVVGDEHGQCMGHIHSFTAALMGLIRYAEVTHDARLMEFVREGYEFQRNFGIARIGLFGEMCAAGDMTYLAVKLSRLGVGDYWEDVDQYVRNQLAEGQVTDLEKLKKAVAAGPFLTHTDPQHPLRPDGKQDAINPLEDTTDQVCERFVGNYLTENSWPTCIPRQRFWMVICCPGNATMGMYAAWDGIVEGSDGAVQVNLLLNRASAWLDVDSYLPYEGKTVIRNKTAQRISVRIPRWVDRKAVTSRVNGTVASPFWVDRYLVFTDMKPKDEITLTFPMVETKESYTLKWKRSALCWQESNNPGNHWEPDDPPARFTFTLRGNTVVDVSPREDNANEYQFYQRDFMRQDKAPMLEVTRFVTDKPIKW
jgi:hypothetical protein